MKSSESAPPIFRRSTSINSDPQVSIHVGKGSGQRQSESRQYRRRFWAVWLRILGESSGGEPPERAPTAVPRGTQPLEKCHSPSGLRSDKIRRSDNPPPCYRATMAEFSCRVSDFI